MKVTNLFTLAIASLFALFTFTTSTVDAQTKNFCASNDSNIVVTNFYAGILAGNMIGFHSSEISIDSMHSTPLVNFRVGASGIWKISKKFSMHFLLVLFLMNG